LSLDGANQTAALPANGLTATLQGNQLEIKTQHMNVTTKYPGFSIDVSQDETYALALVDPPTPNLASPGKVMVLTPINTPKPDTSAVLTPGLQIAEAVIAPLLAVVGVALGVASFKGPLAQKLSARTAKIVARVIAALVAAVGIAFAAALESIRLTLQNGDHTLPPFNTAINVALGGITFPAGTGVKFSAEQAAFADGVQITIATHFA
jgi:hypothetical protein